MKLREIQASLKAGDNKALRYMYKEFGEYCTKTLIIKRGCPADESEGLFIEAIMIFREKVLSGAIQELTNTRYYLYKTCENIYLAKLKLEKSKNSKLSEIEYFFYSNDANDGSEEWNEKLSQAAKKAWETLSEKCKDILSYFYVDSLRMTEIAELMNFASVDVAKTTKSRCYKRLVQVARQDYSLASE